MPANLTKSPWRATRKRQDFIEDLYLNISLDAADGMYGSTTPQERGGLFKISLATTAAPCLGNNIHDHDDVQSQLMDFVRALYYSNHDQYDLSDSSTITNAFTAAGFLANQAWLQSLGPYDQTWQVTYDMGADTIIPVISDAGIAIVSLLLGVFLTCLLSLAVYGAWVPRWTDQLDAFAILRLGAGFADEVRSQKVEDPEHDGLLCLVTSEVSR